ncbi:MAG: tetratricopeptide repeat protein [Planctomycetes bacterium]|nr:tetratricopeptide repeat protein [Planctomycetota bacterium]
MQILFVALLAVVIWRSGKLADPRYSKLGALALVLALGAWLVPMAVGLAGDDERVPHALVTVLAGGAMVGQLIAACVLASLCLTRWRGRPSTVERGHRSAVAALVLSGMTGAALAVVVAHGMVRIGMRAGDDGAVFRLDEQDFELRVPSSAWRPFDGGDALERGACLIVRRLRPEIVMSIAVSNVGETELDDLERLSRESLDWTLDGIRWGATRDLVLDDVTFRRLPFEGTPRVGNSRQSFVQYLAVQSPRTYEITFTTDRWTPEIDAECDEAMHGFRVLGLRKPSSLDGDIVDIHDRYLGFDTKLRQLGWFAVDAENESWDWVLFRAQRQHSFAFASAFEWKSGPPSLDAFVDSALHTIGIDDSGAVVERRAWSPGGELEGLELVALMKVEDEDFKQIVRFALSPERGWLASAWYPADSRGESAGARCALDAVRFFEPTAEKPTERSLEPRTTLKWLHSWLGNWHAERGDTARAIDFFRQAVEADPIDAEVARNLAYALESTGRGEEALAALDAVPDELWRQSAIRSTCAAIKLRLGRVEEAEREFRALHEERELDDDGFLTWTESLSARGEHAEAAEIARRHAERHAVLDVQLRLASELFAAGEVAESIAGLERLAADPQAPVDALYELAEQYNASGSFEDAMRVVERLQARGERTGRTALARGWSLMGREEYDQAKAAFEAAFELAPGDPDVTESLMQASLHLGEGPNSTIKSALEPAPLPEELARELDVGPTHSAERDDAPAVYRSLVAGTYLRRDEPARTTTRSVIELRGPSALAEFGSLRTQFLASFQRAYVNSLRVLDADGELVAEGDVATYYVSDVDPGQTSDARWLNVPVPSLRVGHRIEYTVTVEDRSPLRAPPWVRAAFGGPYPVDFEAHYVIGDPDLVGARVGGSGEFTTLEGGDFRAWFVRDLAARVEEEDAPPMETLSPMLWLGDEHATWREVGLEYLRDIRGRLAVTPWVEERARELVGDASTLTEKATRLAEYVRDTINYSGISFGVRGRIPRSADETLAGLDGDCKDQAVLLLGLLHSVGVEASLVLIHSQDALCEDLPSMQQFDHMIVHVPVLGAAGFVDPTDPNTPPGRLLPPNWFGALALLLDPAEPRVVSLPTEPVDATAIWIRRTITPSGERDLTVEDELRAVGYEAARLRSVLGRSKADSRAFVRRALAAVSAARLDSVEVDGADDPERELVLRIGYRVAGARVRIGELEHAPLPIGWEKLLLSLTPEPDRRHPVRVSVPLVVETTATFRGTTPLDEHVSGPAEVRGTDEFGRWTRTARSATEDGVPVTVVESRVEIEAGQWSAARHAELATSRRELLDALTVRVGFPPSESGH